MGFFKRLNELNKKPFRRNNNLLLLFLMSLKFRGFVVGTYRREREKESERERERE